jgi:hypothetical protein
MELAVVKVDVLPLQAEQLPQPQAGEQGGAEEWRES